MANDPYVYPGTNVLKNRHGIRDSHQLAQLESDISGLAIARLEAGTELPGGFDLKHLQDLHRFIFGTLYPWAGEIRSVYLAKGTSTFCSPQFIESSADELFSKLPNDLLLQSLPLALFVERLAALWGDINALHPFREGNGRSTRAFLSALARSQGRPISWANLGRAANVDASIAAQRGDLGPMVELLTSCLTDAGPGSGTIPPEPRAPRG